MDRIFRWGPGDEQTFTYKFPKPWTFSAADFGSVEFSLPSSWRSSEDERIEIEQQRKADADRQRFIMNAQTLGCSLIYKSIGTKKVGELTVKEDQDVRACQSLGIYSPY
jgi:hypothetical protein